MKSLIVVGSALSFVVSLAQPLIAAPSATPPLLSGC